MQPPLKTFGVCYEHAGKRYAFDIKAISHDDAAAKLTSISSGVVVGEMHPQPEVTSLSGGCASVESASRCVSQSASVV
jgi:hypothetical protein